MGISNELLLGLFIVFTLVFIAEAIVTYVLTAKSLYVIAQRRKISNPWMAWIPVANSWLLGSVSDQYKKRKYGYDPELRKTLLTFSIIVQAGAMLINAFNLYNNMISYGSMAMAPVFLLMILALAVLGVAIAFAVYSYKAHYDLFASCKPKFAVLFLVLSIVTPAGPFLMYACRNSDDGLPVQTEE